MLFLLTAFALESKCKSTKNISYGKKKYSHMSGKRCIFVIEKYVNICRKIECKWYDKERLLVE